MATTRFVWDYANDSYLMEKDETGATTAVYTNEPVQYGYLVSQRRDNATNYYHFDGQLSTRQLTDASQGISDSYAFSACGTAIARTGTTVNPFAYIGALGYFANPMQVYVRRRVYDAVTARWLSKDPSPHNGSSNALAYADNNPIMRTDPSGLRWRRRCWRWRPRCRPRRWRCENISDSETPTPVPTIEMPSTERTTEPRIARMVRLQLMTWTSAVIVTISNTATTIARSLILFGHNHLSALKQTRSFVNASGVLHAVVTLLAVKSMRRAISTGMPQWLLFYATLDLGFRFLQH
jgi:RHS repeat-associated protein